MKHLIEKIQSLPKSLYVCMRFFPLLQALRIPILVRYNTKLKSLSGSVKFNSGGVRTAMLTIGFGQVGIVDEKYERSIIQIGGKLILNGKVNLGTGSKLCVTKTGILTIGDNFINTAKTTIICDNKITIGNNVLVSWDTLIMDTDWHSVMNTITNETFSCVGEISIGNNVWLGCRAVVLKNSCIPDGCIVAANALVNKSFVTRQTLLAGNPAKERKQNITRKL